MSTPRKSSPDLISVGVTVALTWAMYANGYPILTTVVIGMVVLALMTRLRTAQRRRRDGE